MQTSLFPQEKLNISSQPNLKDYDWIIINSSGGKDSLAAIWEVCNQAHAVNFPWDRIVISHQDLGRMEWPGTTDLVYEQAALFDLSVYVTRRRDNEGNKESLLDYARRRGKWPSSQQRWCTSDFKRGPGSRVVTELCPGREKNRVLHVFGFRAEESPARSKKVAYERNKRLSTKNRIVDDWLPIHDWSTKDVWTAIKGNNLPYHKAYDLGMPRLSCVFCIMSPFDALVVAAQANPDLLDEYIAVEQEIGHDFQHGKPLSKVKEALLQGYTPKQISNWVM